MVQHDYFAREVNSVAQWLVPRVSVEASPENFLGMRFLESFPRHTES